MATSKPPRFLRRPSGVSLLLQNVEVQARFPGFRFRKDGEFGVWRGAFTPRPSSPDFLVEVRYRTGGIPRVRLLRPALRPDARHIYKGGYLCLYWPEEDPWTPDKFLATFIFPLVWSWLGYYELWLETGKWFGPESPHLSASHPSEEEVA
jgi:hypothetical protein